MQTTQSATNVYPQHVYAPQGKTHYIKALAFIQAHGFFAAITKDGLLGLMECYGSDIPDGDCWYNEPMLFDVDQDGMVSSREVRNWLGY